MEVQIQRWVPVSIESQHIKVRRHWKELPEQRQSCSIQIQASELVRCETADELSILFAVELQLPRKVEGTAGTGSNHSLRAEEHLIHEPRRAEDNLLARGSEVPEERVEAHWERSIHIDVDWLEILRHEWKGDALVVFKVGENYSQFERWIGNLEGLGFPGERDGLELGNGADTYWAELAISMILRHHILFNEVLTQACHRDLRIGLQSLASYLKFRDMRAFEENGSWEGFGKEETIKAQSEGPKGGQVFQNQHLSRPNKIAEEELLQKWKATQE